MHNSQTNNTKNYYNNTFCGDDPEDDRYLDTNYDDYGNSLFTSPTPTLVPQTFTNPTPTLVPQTSATGTDVVSNNLRRPKPRELCLADYMPVPRDIERTIANLVGPAVVRTPEADAFEIKSELPEEEEHVPVVSAQNDDKKFVKASDNEVLRPIAKRPPTIAPESCSFSLSSDADQQYIGRPLNRPLQRRRNDVSKSTAANQKSNKPRNQSPTIQRVKHGDTTAQPSMVAVMRQLVQCPINYDGVTPQDVKDFRLYVADLGLGSFSDPNRPFTGPAKPDGVGKNRPSSLDHRCRANDIRLTPPRLKQDIMNALRWRGDHRHFANYTFDPFDGHGKSSTFDAVEDKWVIKAGLAAYVNPPFSRLREAADKCILEAKMGNEIVFVCPYWYPYQFRMVDRLMSWGFWSLLGGRSRNIIRAGWYKFENPEDGTYHSIFVVVLHYRRNTKTVTNIRARY